ncbi:hypothetical protein ENSA5_44020 [Enhygromyxa salina]|uniref:Prolyl 4-hydroxylase alpha subunit domain-containing protein n=1 Tax=Enhygromyxa salina TaxID=215803 RepID=A0A2S9XK40_9BACT|nr:hypothetical protein [Enhygromyxa salina]PRP93225.1 hypothetical protein ENSA5_44020 [Enhygromyxa salina]
MTVWPSQPAPRPRHLAALRCAPRAAELSVIDGVLAPATCRTLIREADVDRWLTTTAEIPRAANGPHTCPPRRVAESDRPCRLLGGEDDRPRFAVIDAPVLALRLFYRLSAQLSSSREDAELAGLKPLLRCLEYRRGEGTRAHCDPTRETSDGQRSQLSVVVFLNDRFVGGGIEFPDLGRTVEARVGRACVFPHSLRHIDHVLERGRKFVLETEVFYSSDWAPYRG